MQKCRSLVSKKVSISLLWGLGLGRENERLGLEKMWEGLSLGLKNKRLSLMKMWEGLGLGLKNKRLGLAPQGLVYISVS